ncbi:MAG: hypothetical protein HOO97_11535 [Sideroxydans sp.]|nr:hypothetical protein [Sideroxydans sp.]
MATLIADSKNRPSLQVPFGQAADGLLYEPRQVPLGKNCGCICSACGRYLYAKHCFDSDITPHFQHAAGTDCSAGYMTAIHKAAQQLIEQEKKLFLPEVVASLQITDALGITHQPTKKLFHEGVRQFFIVTSEQAMGTIRPDISAKSQDFGHLLIEVAVTHFVTEEKLTKARELGLPLLEIDLSELRAATFDELHRILFSTPELKNWLFHPQLEIAKRELKTSLKNTLDSAKEKAATLKLEDEQRRHEESLRKKEEHRQKQYEENRRLAAEQERAENFRRMSECDKTRILTNWTKTTDLLQLTGTHVKGGQSFGVSNEHVWQAAIFAGLIHQQLSKGVIEINKKDAASWLSARFNITPKFPESEYIAVWYYLVYLANAGALANSKSGVFKILVSGIESFRLLQKWKNGETSIEQLTWVDESNWPADNTSKAITRAVIGADNCEQFAFLPTVRLKTPNYICQKYHVGNLEEHRVLLYLICAGFLREAQ